MIHGEVDDKALISDDINELRILNDKIDQPTRLARATTSMMDSRQSRKVIVKQKDPAVLRWPPSGRTHLGC